MGDAFAGYLNDHLAGCKATVDLLRAMRQQYRDEPIWKFTVEMLDEIEQDRQTLERIIAKVSPSSSHDFKDAVVRFGGKLTSFILHRDTYGGLGTLQELELLGLGILGKKALWQALKAASSQNGHLQDIDFNRLITRARQQHAKVEEWRLTCAREILRLPATVEAEPAYRPSTVPAAFSD